jgi:hypothetical protein
MSGVIHATHVGSTPQEEPLATVVPPTFLRKDTRALCADHDPELWFDGDNKQAKDICHRCPLQAGCGQWGFARQEWGVWAGHGSGQRRLGHTPGPRKSGEQRDDNVTQAVKLRDRGLSYTEIALRLGVTWGTVKKYLSERAA